jgi:hypothetical protein
LLSCVTGASCWLPGAGQANLKAVHACCIALAWLLPFIIIIMLPNQAIASTPSAPRPSGAEGRGSTAPLCLQLLRTSQAGTRYSAILLEITRHLPLLPQISSDTKRNNYCFHSVITVCQHTVANGNVTITQYARGGGYPALHACIRLYSTEHVLNSTLDAVKQDVLAYALHAKVYARSGLAHQEDLGKLNANIYKPHMTTEVPSSEC